MHTLDGDPLNIGDTVFVLGLGPATVQELLTEDRFRVLFPTGRQLTYSSNGRAARASYRTLYWHDPVVATPMKNDTRWSRLTPVITALVGAFETAS